MSYYPQQSSDDTIDKNVINVSWKLCPKTCMYYPWSTTGIRGGYYGMGCIIFDTTYISTVVHDFNGHGIKTEYMGLTEKSATTELFMQ